MKKINYSVFQAPHYFGSLLLFFLVFCFIITLIFIQVYDGFVITTFLIKYIIVLFLIITVAVLIESKNRSEYISPFETIHIREFFNDFNVSVNKKQFVNKYNAKTLKQLKKNIKDDIKYELTNIIKKNKYYELHICERPHKKKLYSVKFLFRKNNHKLTILKESDEIRIIRIN